jgi:hypothetical protein
VSILTNAAHPFTFYPAFISPLTEKEHARIGRIAILWGQIDFFVEFLVNEMTGMSYSELDALQINSKNTASKAGYVKALSKRLVDIPRTSEAIVAFCKAIDEVKTQRNHVFHGAWGLHCNTRTETVVAAARKRSAMNSPFMASSLPALERKLCECSRLGADALTLLVTPPGGTPTANQFTEFFHSHDGSADQKWLTQWQGRNPLTADCLDQNAKEGQLPGLKKLRPQK